MIEFSAIAAVSADGDGSDDAMVLRTPKALPNRRCGRQTDRQVVLYFSNNTQNTFALLCSETGLR